MLKSLKRDSFNLGTVYVCKPLLKFSSDAAIWKLESGPRKPSSSNKDRPVQMPRAGGHRENHRDLKVFGSRLGSSQLESNVAAGVSEYRELAKSKGAAGVSQIKKGFENSRIAQAKARRTAGVEKILPQVSKKSKKSKYDSMSITVLDAFEVEEELNSRGVQEFSEIKGESYDDALMFFAAGEKPEEIKVEVSARVLPSFRKKDPLTKYGLVPYTNPHIDQDDQLEEWIDDHILVRLS